MKTFYILIISFFALADSQAQNTWTQKTNYGGQGVQQAVGFSIGNKGYILTGMTPTATQEFWEYDQSSDTWAQRTNFSGTARQGAVGFSIGTKGYIGTGYDGSNYKTDFWEFNPSSNSWTQKASYGGQGVQQATGFSIGAKGYIGTGMTPSATQEFWEYSQSSDAWTQKANFSGTARQGSVGFSIGTNGYIGTGYDGTNYKNDLWEYSSSTTGVENIETENLISIYPNPSNGQINIVSLFDISLIKITNLLGQTIYSASPKAKNYSLNLDNDGIYLMMISSDKGTVTRTLTITR